MRPAGAVVGGGSWAARRGRPAGRGRYWGGSRPNRTLAPWPTVATTAERGGPRGLARAAPEVAMEPASTSASTWSVTRRTAGRVTRSTARIAAGTRLARATAYSAV